MTVVVIGPITADPTRSLAEDEAAVEVVIAQLRARGLDDLVLVSGSPAQDSERFGVTAIRPFGFDVAVTPSRLDRDVRYAELSRAARGEESLLDASDPAWPLIEALGSARAVVVTGGSALASNASAMVYELAAVALIAAHFEVPFVLSSQSFASNLPRRDGELLASALSRSSLVGTREPVSATIARELGAPADHVVVTADDLVLLEPSDDSLDEPAGYCVVSLAPLAEEADHSLAARTLAGLLDVVARRTGLELVFVPHEVPGAGSEVAFHAEVARALVSAPHRFIDEPRASTIAGLSAGASLVIADRAGAVSFAIAVGAPTIGITGDEAAGGVVEALLSHVGLGDLAVPVLAIPAGLGEQAIASIWAQRDRIVSHLAAARARMIESQSAWWDAVASLADDRPLGSHSSLELDRLAILDPELASVFHALADWTAQSAGSARFRERSHGRRASVDGGVIAFELERKLGMLTEQLNAHVARNRELEAALVSSHELARSIAEPQFSEALGKVRIRPTQTELESFANSRLFRSTRRLRHAYAAARRFASRVRNRLKRLR